MPWPHHWAAEAAGLPCDPSPLEWGEPVSSEKISCSGSVCQGPSASALPTFAFSKSPARQDDVYQCTVGCPGTQCGMRWQWMDWICRWWLVPCVQEHHSPLGSPCCWCRNCKGSKTGSWSNASSRSLALGPGTPAPAREKKCFEILNKSEMVHSVPRLKSEVNVLTSNMGHSREKESQNCSAQGFDMSMSIRLAVSYRPVKRAHSLGVIRRPKSLAQTSPPGNIKTWWGDLVWRPGLYFPFFL